MRYRRFGKTNWQVSEIAMGGSWFYGRPEYGLLPVAHGVAMVERALELGINYFDTAPLYGQGRSEKVLGHALKGVDAPYYLATKVGYYPAPFDYTRDTVWRGFEASLLRLQRDSVDLLQLHEAEQAGWEGIFGRGRALEAMLEIREQGLAQHIGLTGSDLELMRDVLAECDDFVSVITFLKYDLLVQTAKEILLPTAAARDVAIILASPLHAGLLGSKRDAWKRSRPLCRAVSQARKNRSPARRRTRRHARPRAALLAVGSPSLRAAHRRCNNRRTRSLHGRFRRPLPITRTHRPH